MQSRSVPLSPNAGRQDATISEQYLENTRDEMAEELLAAFEKSVEKTATGGVKSAHRWRYAVPMGQSGFRSL